jgi:hypothetical protein
VNLSARVRTKIGHTGGKTTDFSTWPSGRQDLTKELGSRRDVGGPAKPASVTGIEVQEHVGLLEFGYRVRHEGLVSQCGVGTLLHGHVGDEVGKPIGFDNEDYADGGELCDVCASVRGWVCQVVSLSHTLDLCSNCINVCLVHGSPTIGDAELSSRRLRCTVTIGKVVYDGLDELVVSCGRSSSKIRAKSGNLCG